ncbi:MAG: SNF2-related protein, partial [Desulfobacterales bacterium]|nr:SNF2-related protein [Desulfobacterales bacterium]
IESSCNCPYPKPGCKHAVAAALNARTLLLKPRVQDELFPETEDPFLNESEIREQAYKDREDRAKADQFTPVRGEMFKGDHKVITKDSRTYTVCFHDPVKVKGHCSCPDYLTNGLGICKHMLFMADHLSREPGFKAQVKTETLPFVDIYWDSLAQAPRLYPPGFTGRTEDLKPALEKYFNMEGVYTAADISLVMGLMLRLRGDRRVKVRENLLKRVDHRLQTLQLEKMAGRPLPGVTLKRPLYPFQEEGVAFGVLKTGVLIGDEMGLGKTAQAIAMSLIKGEVFGFSKVLVITLASLKSFWKQEVEAVTRESACIVQGTPAQRKRQYTGKDRFKISHYEAVMRDVGAISAFNPDIIILDEAQRIRNFSTKTAEAVKRLPKKHAIVLTGTPLENKPEDLYSIVQFLDPYRFTPLWQFATDHFLIPKTRVTSVTGYKNLGLLRDKVSDILIRRSWEDVRSQLPETVTTT